MNKADTRQQSTSILELMYLIKAKNSGELSFSEWVGQASAWARVVLAEHEAGKDASTPPNGLMQAGD